MDAKAIYQANLDAVSRALWERDLSRVLDHIAIPNTMLTVDATVVMNTAAEVQEAVSHLRDHYARIGAETYHRVCKSAKFIAHRDDMIVGIHETYVMRGGRYLIEPFTSQMTLRRFESGWKGVRNETAIALADCPVVSPDMAVRQRQEMSR